MELQNNANEDLYRSLSKSQLDMSDSMSEITTNRNPKKAGKWTEEEVSLFFYNNK
jgi:hypothetical protein